MSGTDVVQRTPQQELVAQVRSDQFRSEIALALPENVTPERFVRVAITALQASPSIAELERASVLRSLLQSAAMGLLPDAREAAIVPFKGKAQLIPMIAGFRKIAGEYGWTIYTAIAYEHDEFHYEQGLDVVFRHVPVRPGGDRGDPIAAYAVGKHADGRRELEVLTVEEVEKIRATSQTARKEDGPWTQWWEQMAEKSAGKRLFKKLPLSDEDKRVRVIRAAVEPMEAVAAMYGPEARAALASGETVDRSTGEVLPASGGSADTGERPAVAPTTQQAEASAPSAGDAAAAPTPSPSDASAPEPDDEPSLFNEQETPGSFVVPDAEGIGESWRGKTLAEIAALEQTDDKTGERLGEKWFAYVAKNPSKYPPELYAALQHFRPQLFDAKAS